MRAGSATRIINFRVGDDLAGQLHRRICVKIRDNLEANFFFLENDVEKVLMVSLDLAGLFESDLVREWTNFISVKTGIEEKNIIITSTHTHCGPVLRGALHDIYPLDAEQLERIGEYSTELERKIVRSVGKALANMEPVTLATGNGTCRFGISTGIKCWRAARLQRQYDIPRCRLASQGPRRCPENKSSRCR